MSKNKINTGKVPDREQVRLCLFCFYLASGFKDLEQHVMDSHKVQRKPKMTRKESAKRHAQLLVEWLEGQQ